MRKTNKQSTRLADDKKGVILITILFIVAVALIFITTSLMISIAARQRVYSNAKSDQARLTVTSLSQSIWQAIYSQQITDAQLMALAKANALVQFTSSDMPGMIAAAPGTTSNAETTAYFYAIDTDVSGNPTKIGIECKCKIGDETQYYTLVLKKNGTEGAPSPMFNLTVEIGNGGNLDSCIFGFDASKVTSSSRTGQVRYDARDNVCFIHGSNTYSTQDGSGFYTDLILEGNVFLQDACFSGNVYFLGGGGINFNGGINHFDGASDNSTANMYFWGVEQPFFENGSPMANATSVRMGGIRDVYFNFRNTGTNSAPVYSGFSRYVTGYSGSETRTNFNDTMGISGQFHYEEGMTFDHSASNWASNPESHSAAAAHYTGMPPTVNPDTIDTTGEVQSEIINLRYSATATEITTSTTSLSAGVYRVNSDLVVSKIINCNVSGGDIYIFVESNKSITTKRPDSAPEVGGFASGFLINGSGDHNVYIVLKSGATFTVSGGNGGNNTHWCGVCDTRCFTGGIAEVNINQNVSPRFIIVSSYTGGTQVRLGVNGGGDYYILTAMLGLFPSTQGGNNGGGFVAENSNYTQSIFYGRIACGSIDTSGTGGELMVPYCPTGEGSVPHRETAYRDNTDFSVITEECGYFTA